MTMTLPRSVYAHRIAGVAIAAAMLLTFTRPADAAFKLRLTQGAVVKNIVDNGVGDLSPVVGQIVFTGQVGNYQINTVTGLSKGVLVSGPNKAQMDLSSLDTSCVSAACSAAANLTLKIELTDTSFLAMPSKGKLFGSVGGTVNGTATYKGYVSTTNTEFATSPTSVSMGPFVDVHPGTTSTAFSGTDSKTHGALSPYSMTLVTTIVHPRTRALSTSYDFELDNVPEPALLSMFGVGLAAAAAAARRRQSHGLPANRAARITAS
jgi:hypothetical protein